MPSASCLCGDVGWEVEGAIPFMSHCHCGRCRKAHGTAFATYVTALADRFRTTRGAERVVGWESSPGFLRKFCGRCGSVVPGTPGGDGQVFLPAGSFLDDPGVRPMLHIFVASKAPWYEIPDQLPRFEAFPPGIDVPVLPDRPPVDPPGPLRGSCLCGAVAFVVTGPLGPPRNCHCSRCRRARSAAHASNVGTSVDGVRFTRGADLLASYKVPEAKFFTQTFCRICGSKLPRVDPSRNLTVVPLGALDDDPGVGPAMHIFVSAKAPWFEIADRLPQYAEYPPSA
ncbi:MAG TPA: GFA family protein [Candidatus Binatia bacterium]|jgi:hypothetical protein|nr:GFA family protein [Candidatus Binatia bacterium]